MPGLLKASEAVDWSMLACTLVERLALPKAPDSAAGLTSGADGPMPFLSQPLCRRTLSASQQAAAAEKMRLEDHLSAHADASATDPHLADISARCTVLACILLR